MAWEFFPGVEVFLFKHILLAIGQQSFKYNYIKSFCRMIYLQMKCNENGSDEQSLVLSFLKNVWIGR